MPGQKRGHGRGESETSPRRIDSAQKEAKALALRKGGATYQMIAKELGYNSKESAYQAIKRALVATIQEPADEYRAILIERLLAMLRSIWQKVLKGDLHAHDRALRINEQLARITGLDKTPHFFGDTINFQQNVQQNQTNVTVGVVDLSKLSEEQLVKYSGFLAQHAQLLAELASFAPGGAGAGPAGNGAPANGSPA